MTMGTPEHPAPPEFERIQSYVAIEAANVVADAFNIAMSPEGDGYALVSVAAVNAEDRADELSLRPVAEILRGNTDFQVLVCEEYDKPAYWQVTLPKSEAARKELPRVRVDQIDLDLPADFEQA